MNNLNYSQAKNKSINFLTSSVREANKALHQTGSRVKKAVEMMVPSVQEAARVSFNRIRTASTHASKLPHAMLSGYRFLRRPLFFQTYQLELGNPAENLKVLTGLTLNSAQKETISKKIARMVPRMSFTPNRIETINAFSVTSLLSTTLLFSSGAKTWNCWKRSLENSWSTAATNCISESASLFEGSQGALALLLTGSAALVISSVSYLALRALLSDCETGGRYTASEELYHEIAEHLKKEVDCAQEKQDAPRLEELAQSARKLKVNCILIQKNLQTTLYLSEEQAKILTMELEWAANYALSAQQSNSYSQLKNK